jgi:hypothetical protein
VKIIWEDSRNMRTTNSTLRSNFPTKAIMKIAKLIDMCLNRQQMQVLPLTMSDVINEINSALQLEEGQKAEEGIINIEIPRYASEQKIVSPFKIPSKDIKWQMKFIEKSTSNCEHVFMNLKGKNQQQPETSNVQSHGSRLVFQITFIYHLMQEMTRNLINQQSMLWDYVVTFSSPRTFPL